MITARAEDRDVAELAPVGEGSASGEDGGNTGGCGCDKPSAEPSHHAATRRSDSVCMSCVESRNSEQMHAASDSTLERSKQGDNKLALPARNRKALRRERHSRSRRPRRVSSYSDARRATLSAQLSALLVEQIIVEQVNQTNRQKQRGVPVKRIPLICTSQLTQPCKPLTASLSRRHL
eukprot:scaffold14502_cov61-Phaeocystis_antarctica.AAC.6